MLANSSARPTGATVSNINASAIASSGPSPELATIARPASASPTTATNAIATFHGFHAAAPGTGRDASGAGGSDSDRLTEG